MPPTTPRATQHDLAATVSFRGVGLFTGRTSSCTLLPSAEPLHFARRDSGLIIPVRWTSLRRDLAWAGLPDGAPIRTTALGHPSAPAAAVGLVEHLLAALAAMGVWRGRIEVEGPEVPVLDGSSIEFVRALRPRLVPAARPIAPLALASVVRVARGEAWIEARPCDPGEPATIEYQLEYPGVAGLHAQRAAWSGDPDEFEREVAPARTFSTHAEAAGARAAGLFPHLSPRDMIVVGVDGTPIDNAWRLPEEPARHKLLDLAGDLALLGRPLEAHVTAHRAGHALTHELVRAMDPPG